MLDLAIDVHAHEDLILINALPPAARLFISLSASIKLSSSHCSTITKREPTMTSILRSIDLSSGWDLRFMLGLVPHTMAGREKLFERERHREPVPGWHSCALACAESG